MSSRKEQKEALRAERERREQEAAAAERRKRMIGYGAAGALVLAAVIAIVVVVLAGGGDGGGDNGRAAEPTADDIEAVPIPEARGTNLDEAARSANGELEQHESEGRSHVSGEVEYKSNPPNSGNHFEFPAEDGFYFGDNAPSPESLVHSLEHGRVIFWYQPNASRQLVGQLKSLYDEDNYHVIVAPNPRRMEAQLAASSWTRTLTIPEVSDASWDALRLFRDRYRDQAPERVP
jgi:hypothetical protein